MLKDIKKGDTSDPPCISMYVPKTNKYGFKMVDKDDLVLYRSIRGTSNLESLHQYLTTSFGHTVAGPWYSDILLTVVRHFYNWRMSMKNRPNFPSVMHYDSLLIDRINNLYENIFGHRKHQEWSTYNENLPHKSAYGVVPVSDVHTMELVKLCQNDKDILATKPMLDYL